MLRLKNLDTAMPERYPYVQRIVPTIKTKGQTFIDNVPLRDNIDLMPQPGLQEAVLMCDCNLIFMAGSATMGKALPVNELVLTMRGWRPIGELLVGDRVMDVHGNEQTIKGVYPQGMKETCKVEMEDGGECEVCMEHLWEVWVKNPIMNGHWMIMNSAEIWSFLDLFEGFEVYLPTYIHYKKKRRKIKSITPTNEKKECVCIKVSSKEGLFITRDYIVTHNTFSGFLKALQGLGKPNYTARLISKRLQDSKKGGSIIRDAKLIFDKFAGCDFTAGEYPTASWEQWNSAIQLIHANFNTENPAEWEEYKDYCKKNQASYIYWDELTEIRDFKAFSYMFSRNRDSSGNKPCTVASFNPEHEHWSTEFLKMAGYIGDDWYAIPSMYGKVTYFVLQGDDIKSVVFGDTPAEVARKAQIELTKEEIASGFSTTDMVKSFTYLSGTAMSNMILVQATGGGSVSNLYNVGETERRKIKDGYFGPSSHNKLTVSRKMIESIFTNPIDTSEEMYATLDVATGKDKTDEGRKTDNCVLWIWKGLTIVAVETFDGDLKELVWWIDNMLTTYNVPVRSFAFDANSVGYYLKSYTSGVPVIGQSRPKTEYDQAGNIILLGSHFNLRTQLMSKTKVLLETSQISCMVDPDKMFPHGKSKNLKKLLDILIEESNIFILEKRNSKYYYRSKDEYISRYKSSPDFMDAIVLRAVFELDARPKKEVEEDLSDMDYAGLYM